MPSLSDEFGRSPPHHDATRSSTSPAAAMSLECDAPTLNLESERSANGELLDSSQSKRGGIVFNHATATSPVSELSSSINDILQSHCRDCLYVWPLRWTAQRLDLLGCRFVPRPTRKVDRVPAQTALELAKHLFCLSLTDFKTSRIRQYLEDHGIIYRGRVLPPRPPPPKRPSPQRIILT